MAEEVTPATHPAAIPDLVAADQGFMSLLGQFFLIPMLIAVTAVGIFVGVKLMTDEEKDPIRLVTELKFQHGSARWQAAFELNSRLMRDPEARKDPRLVKEIVKTYNAIPKTEPMDPDDAKTRVYLVSILGTLRDPEGLPVVRAAMQDPDGATQVAAIQSAGYLGDPVVLPVLLEFAESDDSGLRKVAVFALGLFNPKRRKAENLPAVEPGQDEAILTAIKKAHRQGGGEVRWNAALALSRFGDPDAAATLKSMMDRNALKASGQVLSEEQTAAIVVEGMKGGLELKDESFIPLVENVSKTDPSSDVRAAARLVLQAYGK